MSFNNLDKYIKEFSEKWAEATKNLPKVKIDGVVRFHLRPKIKIIEGENGNMILQATPVYEPEIEEDNRHYVSTTKDKE